MDLSVNFWHSLSPLTKSLLAIIAAYGCYVLCRTIIITKLERIAKSTHNDLDDRLVYFFKKFLWILGLFFTVSIVLKINGIVIGPLLAGAGIAGISLGFAAKETIADILAGIFLIVDQPLRIGDRVKIEKIGNHWGGWGDVVDIGLRRTRIRNTDGVFINYPNGVLANSVVTNFSYDNKPIRVRIRFQVDYDADLALTMEVTARAVSSCSGVLAGSCTVIVRSLDDSGGNMLTGVLMEARYHIEDVKKRTMIRSAVLHRVIDELRINNIPIATPKMRLESESRWLAGLNVKK